MQQLSTKGSISTIFTLWSTQVNNLNNRRTRAWNFHECQTKKKNCLQFSFNFGHRQHMSGHQTFPGNLYFEPCDTCKGRKVMLMDLHKSITRKSIPKGGGITTIALNTWKSTVKWVVGERSLVTQRTLTARKYCRYPIQVKVKSKIS